MRRCHLHRCETSVCVIRLQGREVGSFHNGKQMREHECGRDGDRNYRFRRRRMTCEKTKTKRTNTHTHMKCSCRRWSFREGEEIDECEKVTSRYNGCHYHNNTLNSISSVMLDFNKVSNSRPKQFFFFFIYYYPLACTVQHTSSLRLF